MGATGAIKAGSAFVEMFLDQQALQRGLKQASTRLKRFGKGVSGVGRVFTGIGAAGGAAMIPIIKAASDMEETMNKFDVVFGDSAGRVKKDADKMAASMGRPAEPPGSPSSLNRHTPSRRQAQQLCEAEGMATDCQNASVSAWLATGAAWATKRLRLMICS